MNLMNSFHLHLIDPVDGLCQYFYAVDGGKAATTAPSARHATGQQAVTSDVSGLSARNGAWLAPGSATQHQAMPPIAVTP